MTDVKYVCDTCGKQHKSIYDIAIVDISKIKSGNDSDHYDMCAACREKLMAFIKSMKIKEN